MDRQQLQQQFNILKREASDLGIFTDINTLTSELRSRLETLNQGKYIGLHDQEGEPIISIRAFTKLLNGKISHTSLSSFARGDTIPNSFTALCSIADAMNIKYILSNLEDRPP